MKKKRDNKQETIRTIIAVCSFLVQLIILVHLYGHSL